MGFKGKGKWNIAVSTMGNHVPFGITQCYLPADKGDIPAFTPAEAGTRLSDPGPSRLVTYRDDIRARRRSPIPVITGPNVH